MAGTARIARIQAALDSLCVPSADEPLRWARDQQPLPQVDTLLAILREAPADGLDPRDYDHEPLVRAWQAVRHGAIPPDRFAALERATTRALLSYLSDLHFGRIDPSALGVGFKLPRSGYPLAAVARAAVTGNRLREAVAQARPGSELYSALRAALPRYRALQGHPSLTVLMPVGKLSPGDPYASLDRLALRLAAWGDLPGTQVPWADPPALELLSHLHAPPARWQHDATGVPVYAGAIVEAVRRFQDRHGLDADGVIGSRTWMALNVPVEQRVRQLELSLERLRWLPEMHEGPFLLVNTPAFQLHGFESPGRMLSPSLSMRVVVGRATESDTPVFSDEMRYIVFRPYWYAPRSIIQDEFLVELQADPDYFTKHDLEVIDGRGEQSAVVVPATPENLELLRAGRLAVRQRPGPKNSLGLVKFIFPNSHAVYLHDTPSRSLFVRQRRDFSHGCIRVQDPVALARFVLRDQPEWTVEAIEAAMHKGEDRRTVSLRRPVPVYIVYLTAMARAGGELLFYEDLYGHDTELALALAGQADAVRRLAPCPGAGADLP